VVAAVPSSGETNPHTGYCLQDKRNLRKEALPLASYHGIRTMMIGYPNGFGDKHRSFASKEVADLDNDEDGGGGGGGHDMDCPRMKMLYPCAGA